MLTGENIIKNMPAEAIIIIFQASFLYLTLHIILYLSKMKLKDIVAVSGMPGLYKIMATKSNGIIAKDFSSGKSKFISSRKHQFTPLESIGIYTYEDSTSLDEIFMTMDKLMATDPVPSPKSSSSELSTYFRKVLKDYNEDKVQISDVKKVIKWFNFLAQNNLLHQGGDEEE